MTKAILVIKSGSNLFLRPTSTEKYGQHFLLSELTTGAFDRVWTHVWQASKDNKYDPLTTTQDPHLQILKLILICFSLFER